MKHQQRTLLWWWWWSIPRWWYFCLIVLLLLPVYTDAFSLDTSSCAQASFPHKSTAATTRKLARSVSPFSTSLNNRPSTAAAAAAATTTSTRLYAVPPASGVESSSILSSLFVEEPLKYYIAYLAGGTAAGAFWLLYYYFIMMMTANDDNNNKYFLTRDEEEEEEASELLADYDDDDDVSPRIQMQPSKSESISWMESQQQQQQPTLASNNVRTTNSSDKVPSVSKSAFVKKEARMQQQRSVMEQRNVTTARVASRQSKSGEKKKKNGPVDMAPPVEKVISAAIERIEQKETIQGEEQVIHPMNATGVKAVGEQISRKKQGPLSVVEDVLLSYEDAKDVVLSSANEPFTDQTNITGVKRKQKSTMLSASERIKGEKNVTRLKGGQVDKTQEQVPSSWSNQLDTMSFQELAPVATNRSASESIDEGKKAMRIGAEKNATEVSRRQTGKSEKQLSLSTMNQTKKEMVPTAIVQPTFESKDEGKPVEDYVPHRANGTGSNGQQFGKVLEEISLNAGNQSDALPIERPALESTNESKPAGEGAADRVKVKAQQTDDLKEQISLNVTNQAEIPSVEEVAAAAVLSLASLPMAFLISRNQTAQNEESVVSSGQTSASTPTTFSDSLRNEWTDSLAMKEESASTIPPPVAPNASITLSMNTSVATPLSSSDSTQQGVAKIKSNSNETNFLMPKPSKLSPLLNFSRVNATVKVDVESVEGNFVLPDESSKASKHIPPFSTLKVSFSVSPKKQIPVSSQVTSKTSNEEAEPEAIILNNVTKWGSKAEDEVTFSNNDAKSTKSHNSANHSLSAPEPSLPFFAQMTMPVSSMRSGSDKLSTEGPSNMSLGSKVAKVNVTSLGGTEIRSGERTEAMDKPGLPSRMPPVLSEEASVTNETKLVDALTTRTLPQSEASSARAVKTPSSTMAPEVTGGFSNPPTSSSVSSELIRPVPSVATRDELKKHDRAITKLKKSFLSAESALKQELSKMETMMEGYKSETGIIISELKSELVQTKALLSESKDKAERGEKLQKRVDKVTAELERTRKKLASEKARHKSLESELRLQISMLEGKVFVVESRLEEKRETIKRLEEKCQKLSDESSLSSKESQEKMKNLLRQIADTKCLLEKERANVEEYASKRHDSKAMVSQLQKKLRLVPKLEAELDELRKALSVAEDEKIDQLKRLNKLQKEFEEVSGRLASFEDKAVETSHLVTQLQLRESEARGVSEKLAATIKKLEDRLSKEQRAKGLLVERIDDIKADLKLKEFQLTRVPKLQGKLEEVFREREELQLDLVHVEDELGRKDIQIAKLNNTYAVAVDKFNTKVEKHKNTKNSLRAQIRSLKSELAAKSERLDREIPRLNTQVQEYSITVEEIKEKLAKAETEVRKQKKLVVDMETEFSDKFQTKVEQLKTSKSFLESKLKTLEDGNKQREKQVKETSEKQSKQIFDLQRKVEDLTNAKESLKAKLAEIKEEYKRKDEVRRSVPRIDTRKNSVDARSKDGLDREAPIVNTTSTGLNKEAAVSVKQTESVPAATRSVTTNMASVDGPNEEVPELEVNTTLTKARKSVVMLSKQTVSMEARNAIVGEIGVEKPGKKRSTLQSPKANTTLTDVNNSEAVLAKPSQSVNSTAENNVNMDIVSVDAGSQLEAVKANATLAEASDTLEAGSTLKVRESNTFLSKVNNTADVSPEPMEYSSSKGAKNVSSTRVSVDGPGKVASEQEVTRANQTSMERKTTELVSWTSAETVFTDTVLMEATSEMEATPTNVTLAEANKTAALLEKSAEYASSAAAKNVSTDIDSASRPDSEGSELEALKANAPSKTVSRTAAIPAPLPGSRGGFSVDESHSVTHELREPKANATLVEATKTALMSAEPTELASFTLAKNVSKAVFVNRSEKAVSEQKAPRANSTLMKSATKAALTAKSTVSMATSNNSSVVEPPKTTTSSEALLATPAVNKKQVPPVLQKTMRSFPSKSVSGEPSKPFSRKSDAPYERLVERTSSDMNYSVVPVNFTAALSSSVASVFKSTPAVPAPAVPVISKSASGFVKNASLIEPSKLETPTANVTSSEDAVILNASALPAEPPESPAISVAGTASPSKSPAMVRPTTESTLSEGSIPIDTAFTKTHSRSKEGDMKDKKNILAALEGLSKEEWDIIKEIVNVREKVEGSLSLSLPSAAHLDSELKEILLVWEEDLDEEDWNIIKVMAKGGKPFARSTSENKHLSQPAQEIKGNKNDDFAVWEESFKEDEWSAIKKAISMASASESIPTVDPAVMQIYSALKANLSEEEWNLIKEIVAKHDKANASRLNSLPQSTLDVESFSNEGWARRKEKLTEEEWDIIKTVVTVCSSSQSTRGLTPAEEQVFSAFKDNLSEKEWKILKELVIGREESKAPMLIHPSSTDDEMMKPTATDESPLRSVSHDSALTHDKFAAKQNATLMERNISTTVSAATAEFLFSNATSNASTAIPVKNVTGEASLELGASKANCTLTDANLTTIASAKPTVSVSLRTLGSVSAASRANETSTERVGVAMKSMSPVTPVETPGLQPKPAPAVSFLPAIAVDSKPVDDKELTGKSSADRQLSTKSEIPRVNRSSSESVEIVKAQLQSIPIETPAVGPNKTSINTIPPKTNGTSLESTIMAKKFQFMAQKFQLLRTSSKASALSAPKSVSAVSAPSTIPVDQETTLKNDTSDPSAEGLSKTSLQVEVNKNLRENNETTEDPWLNVPSRKSIAPDATTPKSALATRTISSKPTVPYLASTKTGSFRAVKHTAFRPDKAARKSPASISNGLSRTPTSLDTESYGHAMPVDVRLRMLQDACRYLIILKDFEGIISDEELARRKQELFWALPRPPPNEVRAARKRNDR